MMLKQYIKIYTKEFIAVCPFSGLPDIAKVKIEYYPKGGLAIELKSIKYYLISYKNVGIYQEEVTKRIYTDLKKVLKTDRIRITTKYNVRGIPNLLIFKSGKVKEQLVGNVPENKITEELNKVI